MMYAVTELSQLPVALVWWFVGLTIHLTLTTATMIAFTWSLLFFCRMLGIPWIDGTTLGWVNRS